MGDSKARIAPGDVAKQVRDLMTEKYVAPDYLQLFQELFEAQYQTERKLRLKDVCSPISRVDAGKRSAQGLPALNPDRLQLNEKELDGLLGKVCTIITKRSTGGDLVVKNLLKAERSSEVSLNDLVRATVTSDDAVLRTIANKINGAKEEIIFIGKTLTAPFLRTCARSFGSKIDLTDERSGCCPVCGAVPLMARLRAEDGKRILECSLCSTQWSFRRIKCPYCGNEDPDTLGFLFLEEGPYRIDKCDKCKRYIKTVDERRKQARIILPLEDAATLYLDMVAAREGYSNTVETGVTP